MASIFEMKFHSITAERGHRSDPPANADVMFTINKGGKYKGAARLQVVFRFYKTTFSRIGAGRYDANFDHGIWYFLRTDKGGSKLTIDGNKPRTLKVSQFDVEGVPEAMLPYKGTYYKLLMDEDGRYCIDMSMPIGSADGKPE